jgi:hypothetical protein
VVNILKKTCNNSYIEYVTISRKDLEEFFNFEVRCIRSSAEILDNKHKNKKNYERIYYLLVSRVLRLNLFNHSVKSYSSLKLISNNNKIFSLRRPPLSFLYNIPGLKYNYNVVKTFSDFCASRQYDLYSFRDLFNTIKYQMLHPELKPDRFYIQFEKNGGAGKIFLLRDYLRCLDNFLMLMQVHLL